MPIAVLKHGVIQPVEPLPSDWKDGTELIVEKAAFVGTNGTKDSTDEWMDNVEALATAIRPADDERLMEAVAAIRKQEREAARRRRLRPRPRHFQLCPPIPPLPGVDLPLAIVR